MIPKPTVLFVCSDSSLLCQLTSFALDRDLAPRTVLDVAKLAEACRGVELGCLVFDLAAAKVEVLESTPRLAANGAALPTIALAEHGDIPTATSAIKAGAIAVLEKPVAVRDLFEQVKVALVASRWTRMAADTRAEVLRRLQRLAPEERAVLDGILAARSNKALAVELGCSLRTIEARRAKVMATLAAGSIADVVRLTAMVKPALGAAAAVSLPHMVPSMVECRCSPPA